ncbi:MAG: class I SAM-dependent methyltransferase [Chloroflexota bacterium]
MTQQDDKQQVHDKVKAQFGPQAQKYVTSKVHGQAAELPLLLEMTEPSSDKVALDVATGGGHVALLMAPHMKRVVASDLTQQMLDAAEAFITPQADNVTFELAEAENLPFADASFDVVTCRISAHHFSNIFKFVLESARVLRPGGLLVVQDYVAPEDERAAEYLDSFERLRDPSHVKAYSESEWRSALLDAQLMVERVQTDITHDASFFPFVERMNVPAEAVERLEVMLHQAPDAVKAWAEPRAIGTPEAVFKHRYIMISGRKPVS